MRIGRTLPPAVAPIGFGNILNGILAMFNGDKAAQEFSRQLKEHFNVKHCFLLSSGKAALTLILLALKEIYPERDEVLIPAFTCYSVPAAIVRAGLKIRICDVEPETLDFDYQDLAEQLSAPRVLCVVPTHFFGATANVQRVRELVGRRQIAIVEDAAQSMGAETYGRKAGTLGDVGFFSLGRGKAFSTVSGGIILTDSDDIADALNSLIAEIPKCSSFEQLILSIYATALSMLSRPELFWIPKSLPFLGLGETIYDPGFAIKHLSSFQAGLAAGWQKHLFGLIRTRQKNTGYLLKSGLKLAGGEKLHSTGIIRFPIMVSDTGSKQYVLKKSRRLGLGGADAYPGPVDGIAGLQGYIVGGTSVKAESIVKRIVTFPVHPYVTEEDMDKIAALVQESGAMIS